MNFWQVASFHHYTKVKINMACFICNSEELANLCELCGECVICQNHQHLHASAAEKKCYPFSIGQDPYKGRVLETTRDVAAGDILFEEEPIMSGPLKSSTPICLTCLGPREPKHECAKCKFPMCSPDCAERHSSKPECQILAKDLPEKGGKIDYQAIMPLRCILSKDSPEWHYLQMFEDHLEDRKLTSTWQSDKEGIARQIRHKWGLDQLSEEEILRVEGILDVNTLELVDGNYEDTNVSPPRGFFPITSFASHSCINNTFRTIKNGTMQTRAKMDLKKGTEITLHYAGGFKGRLIRRMLLAEGWFFLCKCQRCQSPSELDSHLSTLKCQKCPKGFVMPDVGSEESKYSCNKCNYQISAEEVGKIEAAFSEKIESCYEGEADKLKMILDESEDKFHPRHYLLLIIKWLLLNIYGRKKPFLYPMLSQSQVQDKLAYCQDYMAALDIIDPGLSHNRGRTMWELYSVKAFILGQKWSQGNITKEDFKVEIQNDLIPNLAEAQRCLEYSPENTFENNVFKLSNQALANSKETLCMIDLIA